VIVVKKSFAVLVAIAGLVGCQSGNNSVSNVDNASTKGDSSFKVALLTPGPVSDAGWNALAYQALQAIHTQLGAQVNNQEAVGSGIKDGLRSYAQSNYQLVFGHGFEYNQPAFEIAKDFPDTVFVTSSGAKTLPNLGAFRFFLEQGFYVAGAMEAKMSKSGVVGEVGGDKIPDIDSTFKAFEAGAKSVNPNIKIITVYTGSGTDVAAAKKATESEIDQGADMVIHQCDDAAQGVFEACKERHILAIGSNADQNDNPSGVVIASALINCTPAFVDVAKQVQNHTFKGSVILAGMENGTIEFRINPKFESQIPPDVLSLITQTEAKIKSGAINVPKENF